MPLECTLREYGGLRRLRLPLRRDIISCCEVNLGEISFERWQSRHIFALRGRDCVSKNESLRMLGIGAGTWRVASSYQGPRQAFLLSLTWLWVAPAFYSFLFTIISGVLCTFTLPFSIAQCSDRIPKTSFFAV